MSSENGTMEPFNPFSKTGIMVSVGLFLLLGLIVLGAIYLIVQLLKLCRKYIRIRGRRRTFTTQRNRNPLPDQEIHYIRPFNVVHVTTGATQTSSEEDVRRRTPPPRYSDVTGHLPSYGSAIRALDQAAGHSGQEQDQQSSSATDSVFSLGATGEDTQPRASPYLRVVSSSSSSPRSSQSSQAMK